MAILGGSAESLIVISPKNRQKYNKENRKPLIIKGFRFLFCDSVGIRYMRSLRLVNSHGLFVVRFEQGKGV